jgi:hypothetical protein
VDDTDWVEIMAWADSVEVMDWAAVDLAETMDMVEAEAFTTTYMAAMPTATAVEICHAATTTIRADVPGPYQPPHLPAAAPLAAPGPQYSRANTRVIEQEDTANTREDMEGGMEDMEDIMEDMPLDITLGFRSTTDIAHASLMLDRILAVGRCVV